MSQKRPRVTSYGGGRPGTSSGSITIDNLTTEAIDAIKGMLIGANFVSFDENGSMIVADRIARLPDPIVEPFEMDSWVHSNQVDGIIAPLVRKDWQAPGKDWGFGISVQHLCGYGYTVENYRREARKFQSWGFECMRSRRGADGKRYEIWYLPGIWAAKGSLKDAFPEQRGSWDTEQECQEFRRRVVDWFCCNASFGTLDLTVQRAALTIE